MLGSDYYLASDKLLGDGIVCRDDWNDEGSPRGGGHGAQVCLRDSKLPFSGEEPLERLRLILNRTSALATFPLTALNMFTKFTMFTCRNPGARYAPCLLQGSPSRAFCWAAQ